MADDKKKEREGLGEYTRNFVGNLFGRDADDDQKDQPRNAQQSAPKKDEESPRDKGIVEYTRDFVGNLVGRDDDDDQRAGADQGSFNDDVRNKAQRDSDRSSNPVGKVTDAVQDAAERARHQSEQKQNPVGKVTDAVQDAAERARRQSAQNQAQNQDLGNVIEKAREAAERAREEAERDQAATPRHLKPATPKPGNPLTADERDELEALRDRVEDLEQQGQPQAQSQRSYTVQPGDSLRAIAQRYYGDEMQWQRIYQANRDKIQNPDLIHPGQEFIIPA